MQPAAPVHDVDHGRHQDEEHLHTVTGSDRTTTFHTTFHTTLSVTPTTTVATVTGERTTLT